MIARGRLLVILCRPAVVMLLGLFTAIGLAQAGQGENRALLAQALIVVFGFLFFSIAVNDLADEQIDRVNLAGDRRRPLLTGAASRTDLTVFGVAAGLVALAVGAALGPTVLVITAAGMAISVCYSLRPVRLADRGAVASMVLPACYVAVPYLVGMFVAHATPHGRDLQLLAGLYLGFIGRILLKDFRDVRGDALFGKRTFLIRHGRLWTCRFSAAGWVAGAALVVTSRGGPDPTMVVTYVGGTCGAVAMLAALSRDRGPRRDEIVISALAILGRGLLICLLAQLAMRHDNWPPAGSTALNGLLALIVTAQTLFMLRHGPLSRLAMAVQRRTAVLLLDTTAASEDVVHDPFLALDRNRRRIRDPQAAECNGDGSTAGCQSNPIPGCCSPAWSSAPRPSAQTTKHLQTSHPPKGTT